MAQISLSKAKLSEPLAGQSTKMRFTVSLSGLAAQDVTLSYRTTALASDKAVAGSDFTAASGSLTIPVGQREAYVWVDVLGDTLREGDESFQLEFSNPAGASFAQGSVATTQGTISDIAPLITVSSPKIAEGPAGFIGKLRFTVTLSAPAPDDVSIAYTTQNGAGKVPATSGADYAAATGTLSIPRGRLQGHIDVDVLGDAATEGDETFELLLSSAVGAGFAKGATLLGTGTIQDDESAKGESGAMITVTAPKLYENELTPDSPSTEDPSQPFSQMRFEVHLSSPSTQEVTVAYKTANGRTATPAKAGQDYLGTKGTLVFVPGSTLNYIYVDIRDDALKESDEVFDLVLSKPTYAGFETGKTLTISATILDDEPVISAAAARLYEGTATDPDGAGLSQMRFEVSLSRPSVNEVKVAYKTASTPGAAPGTGAKAGADYVAAKGTLTFAPGETMGYIYVDIKDDFVYETGETFNLVLSKPVGAGFATPPSITVVGTILDNEPYIFG